MSHIAPNPDISCVDLATTSAMLAGAVAGASAAWMAKRNLLIGMMGGLLTGTLMGRLIYGCGDDPARITTGAASIPSAALVGLAGAGPAAFVIAAGVTFMILRHVHPRPSPARVGWLACGYGVLSGTAMAILRVM
jgi:hypothetical protein